MFAIEFNHDYNPPFTKIKITHTHMLELPLKTSLFSTLSQPSVSAGVGFIYRFDPVRMEVNFGVPLVASKSDAMQRGIQVGVGLEFL